VIDILNELNLTKLEDIIIVPLSHFKAHKHAKLLRQHDYSISKLMSNCFPELKLKMEQKKKISHYYGFWKDLTNQHKFVENIALTLNIKTPDDWYNISVHQVYKYGGYTLLNHYYNGSLIKLLRAIYPDHNWRLWKFSAPTIVTKDKRIIASKAQYLLYQFFQKLIPTYKVEFNSKYSDFNIINNDKLGYKKFIEFDIFIPVLSLAIEYNGEGHYKSIPIYGDFEKVQKRDIFKNSICKRDGITLIVVPYYWDKTIDSVAQAIRHARPDIVLEI